MPLSISCETIKSQDVRRNTEIRLAESRHRERRKGMNIISGSIQDSGHVRTLQQGRYKKKDMTRKIAMAKRLAGISEAEISNERNASSKGK